MKETYTIEEIAVMSMLSTRTIRHYLSIGLLEGEKRDGVWRFTPEQYGAFLDQDMVRQSMKAKANGMLYDFLLQEKKQEEDVCAIIDLPISDLATEAHFRTTLMEQINTLGLRCSYRYEMKSAAARLILRGTPEQIAHFFDVLQKMR